MVRRVPPHVRYRKPLPLLWGKARREGQMSDTKPRKQVAPPLDKDIFDASVEPDSMVSLMFDLQNLLMKHWGEESGEEGGEG